MAITIEKRIDLTSYGGNPEPKITGQLSIIHEAEDGEIVQYYIRTQNMTQGDKNSCAIGVYDKDRKTWSYHDYDELTWGKEKHRISGNRIERLGVKAFPGIGAIAFYKLAHRKITRIVAPVNRKKDENAPPEISAVVNSDGSITFTITPPEKPEYECYRIIMEGGLYSEEYVTYETEITVPKPEISGTFRCFAIGYATEGQFYSKDSNVLELELTGKADTFVPMYYTKEDIDRLVSLKALSFTGHQTASYNGSSAVSVEIPKQEGAVLYGTDEPDGDIGVNGSVYIQYTVNEGDPQVTAEWIKLENVWIRKEQESNGSD